MTNGSQLYVLTLSGELQKQIEKEFRGDGGEPDNQEDNGDVAERREPYFDQEIFLGKVLASLYEQPRQVENLRQLPRRIPEEPITVWVRVPDELAQRLEEDASAHDFEDVQTYVRHLLEWRYQEMKIHDEGIERDVQDYKKSDDMPRECDNDDHAGP